MKISNININNYNILFFLQLSKSILVSFIDSFFLLYFLTLTEHNILPLGIYKLVVITTVFMTIFFVRNLCKSKYRVYLLRAGILLDFVYFLSILILKEKIIDHIYLIGMLHGLEKGMYYSVYNIFESTGINNEERKRFIGHIHAATAATAILFPLVFGSFIATEGFIKSILLVLIIIGIRILLSFAYRDKNKVQSQKTNLKDYIPLMKKNEQIKQVYRIVFFQGLTYSDGAFHSIITIYIIKVFSDSFRLGIFTSIFSLLSCIISILFADFIKPKHYERSMKISMYFTILSFLLMIFYCNPITIIVFNFFQTIFKEFIALINKKNQEDLSNIKEIKKEYKVEYYLGYEFFLFLGRLLSQSIFIIMAFIKVEIILPIFIVFLVLLTTNSIQLQNNLLKKKQKDA